MKVRTANTISKKLGFNVVAFLARWHSRLTGDHVTGGDAHTHPEYEFEIFLDFSTTEQTFGP